MKCTSNNNSELKHFYLNRINLHLYTGSNRARKTSIAIAEETKSMIEKPNVNRVVIVSRTVNNLNSTIETIEKYIPHIEHNEIPITEIVGKAKICPEFVAMLKNIGGIKPEMPDDWEIWKHSVCGNCKFNKIMSKFGKKTIPNWVKEKIHKIRVMDVNEAQRCSSFTCSWVAVREHFQYNISKKQIVLCTYAGLPMLYGLIKTDLKSTVIIFDEGHHIAEISLVYQEDVNKKETKKEFEKIGIGYVNKLKGQLKYVDDLKIRNGDNFKENMEKLMKYFEDSLKGFIKVEVAEKYTSKHKQNYTKKEYETIDEFRKILKQGKNDYEFIRIVRKPKFDLNDFSGIDLLEKLIKEDDNKKRNKLKYLFKTISIIKILQEDENNKLYLDLVEDEENYKSIRMVVVRTDGVKEDRRLIRYIIEDSFKTIIVTSTPYPEKWYPFWLGKRYEIEIRNFPMGNIKFNGVVENSTKKMNDIWGNRDNKEREMKINRMILEKLEPELKRLADENMRENDWGVMVKDEYNLEIFARSKKEKKKLLKELDVKAEQIRYARGSDSEGVQLLGFIMTHGYPMQNIHSEGYRKWAIGEMIGREPNEVIVEYRDIKALMTMIQQSFRTANRKITSGCIFRHMSRYVIDGCMQLWDWLKDVNWVILGEKRGYMRMLPEDKSTFMVKGLIEGELPEYKANDLRIKNDIVEVLKVKCCISINEIMKSVIGNEKTIRQMFHELEDEKIIEEKEIRKYPKKVCYFLKNP